MVEHSAHSPSLEDTRQFVVSLYNGERDLMGNLQHKHPFRVRYRLPMLCGDDVLHAAYLHDTVEDGHTTLDALRKRGYSTRTIELVSLLTKRPGHGVFQEGMDYPAWINALVAHGDADAILIKYHDIKHNISEERTRGFAEAERNRRSGKYREPLALLEAYLLENGILLTPSEQARQVA